MESLKTEVPLKVNKPKKERSEKQKAATAKALDILRAKREAQRKTQEEEVAEVQEEKKAEVIKAKTEKQKAKKLVNTLARAEEVPYITRNDFDTFKNDILSQIKPLSETKKEPTIVEKIVEKPVEKTIVRESVRVVSGNELLDRIFFGKV
jgi:hypothetical protein